METNSTFSSGIAILLVIGVVFFVAYRVMIQHANSKAVSSGIPTKAVVWNGNLLASYRVDWIARLPHVKFDPSDTEHLAAYQLMRSSAPMQHPTLRFEFDPTYYDNAVEMMKAVFVDHYMPDAAQRRAQTLHRERFMPHGRSVLIFTEDGRHKTHTPEYSATKIPVHSVVPSNNRDQGFRKKFNATTA